MEGHFMQQHNENQAMLMQLIYDVKSIREMRNPDLTEIHTELSRLDEVGKTVIGSMDVMRSDIENSRKLTTAALDDMEKRMSELAAKPDHEDTNPLSDKVGKMQQEIDHLLDIMGKMSDGLHSHKEILDRIVKKRLSETELDELRMKLTQTKGEEYKKVLSDYQSLKSQLGI